MTTNLINGKRYIGQKKSKIFLENRYLGSGIYIRRAINKYGSENFHVNLIEWCNSDDELNEREKYWIDYYNAVEDPMFYNLSKGGEGTPKGSKHSEECKRKISLSNRGKSHIVSEETRKRISEKMSGNKNPMYGIESPFKDRHHTLETKKKISEALTGNQNAKGFKLSEESRTKISKALTGIKRSEETKTKISKSKKGCKYSEETRKNMSAARKRDGIIPPSQKGKKVINNGIINKKVYPSELEYYLNNGFVLGWIPKERRVG